MPSAAAQQQSPDGHPLSHGQRALWYLHQLAPESPAYNGLFSARVRSRVDVSVLLRALGSLMDRHALLRTVYIPNQGVPRQLVRPRAEPPLEHHDASGWSEEELKAQARAAIRSPFDLERGPVWRIHLFTRSERDHVLLVVAHHILVDMAALSLLVTELTCLYQAERTGAGALLPPLRLGYADYVGWQERLLAGAEGDRLFSYWREQLSGELPVLDLPLDHPRPAVQTYQGAAHAFALGQDVLPRIRALARAERVTPFMVLLAAYQALLHRFTGQDDVVVGSPVPGRRGHEAFEAILGSFMNMLPLRARLSGDPTFRELLAQARGTVQAGREHQEYPFSLMVERLVSSRDASRSPVFQTLFSLQRAPREELTGFFVRLQEAVRVELGGLELEPIELSQQEGQLDLALEIAEVGGRYHAELKYNTSLLEAPTVERMAKAFTLLLDAALADPDRSVRGLALLDGGERHRLLTAWNDRREGFPLEEGFPALFRAQAGRTPDAAAVRHRGEALTYRQLADRAGHLASHLSGLGLEQEPRVAVLLDRGIELLASFLGILEAGGAYLPLDPAQPPARLAQILQQGGVAGVLTSRARAELLGQALEALPEGRRPAVWIAEELLGRQTPPAPPTRVSPEGLAFVIFTSGSTGVPKGAMVEHRGMLNHLYAKIADLGLRAGDVVAQTAPQGFVISIWQLLSALLVGATVQVVEDEVATDPPRLLDLLEAEGVTVLEPVPSLLRVMMEDAEARGAARPALRALRWVVPTGEALVPELCRRWFSLYSRIPLLNAYGSSECSDDVAHWPMTASPGPEVLRTPIGRPVPNVQLYLLDERLQPVPLGVVGELYVGGAAVGRGYLADPVRTAERFAADPFSTSPGTRLYRTGDLCRRLAGGEIEYVGRADHQVKVRGIRIELGEIESALARHPAVREAVVVARRDGPGGNSLVGYVVPRATDPALERELRKLLSSRLPEYMVPQALVMLEALPLNAHGKVDRRALPAPVRALPVGTSAAEGPRNPLESRLVELWRPLLQVERVGIHDNFFALGGHSLLAVQLIIRLREAFGVELPLNAIFELSTVARQAEALARRAASPQPAEAAPPQPRIVPAPELRFEAFPLTDLQQAYWLGQTGLLELSGAGAVVYVEVETLGLDVERFNRAFGKLIERHPMMRTIIRPDGLQQTLAEVPPFVLEVLDLRRHEPAEAERILEAVRREVARENPRTDRWPMFKLRAHRLDERRILLHLGWPLLIGDLRSYRVINRDLERLYRDPDAALEPLALGYRDYVEATRSLLESETGRKAEAYWRGRLADLPPAPQLPLARAPSQVESGEFQRWKGTLPGQAWSQIKERAARAGLTPTSVLCAAYAEVLTAWSQSAHFTLTLLYQNRPPLHPQIQDVVGNFSTTLLLEVDNRTGQPFQDRTRQLQSRLWSDIEHSLVSGVRVVRERAQLLGAGAAATAMPVVFASTLHVGPGEESSTELLGRAAAMRLQTPHVWIDHQVGEEAGALTWSWDVLAALFPEGVVDAMIGAYRELLERLAQGDGWLEPAAVRLPAAQLAAREAANATGAPAAEGLLHAPFIEQALKRPGHPAVVDARRRLTYGELRRESDRLGRKLRALGARPGMLVPVVMEKGWEQIVAALGVLRAGAAYLPIDPALPPERLRYLLDHGQAHLALTQPWLEPRLAWPAGVERVVVDEGSLAGGDEALLEPMQGPGDLAYVIYTSGSTGLPKGVMIEHRSAVSTVLDLNERFGVGPQDRVLGLSSLGFDLSVYDVFGTLAAGGTLVLPEPGGAREPAHWAKWVASEGVTVWNSVPALMQLLTEHAGQKAAEELGSLRLVLLSGDWIPVGLPDRIRAVAKGARVVSLGGATEASIWSIAYPIGEVDPSWQSIPYGLPLRGQRFHVLDEVLEPRPPWVSGELYIAGAGLARGYWRDEEKTRARFLHHPRTGERLYRTGDLGRYLPNGEIEFQGRQDLQVKVQGYRIELGEIEAALAQHPEVRAAVVAALGETRGEKRLVAYVVAPADAWAEGGPGRLRTFLREKLPEYMVPSAFVRLDELPLTPNGKVDRKALPSAEQGATRRARAFVPPRTPVELQLTRIWEELLDTRPVGVRDNFFDLGGHSFAAVRLTVQVQRQLGRELSLATLLQSPTVEQLAAALDSQSSQGPWSPLVPIQSAGAKRPLFFAHPVGGNVLCYLELSRRIGPDRPFYGLQARGLTGEQEALFDLPQMARSYVEAIRAVQPHGPYLLGGWSMGGLVTFEMARQLEAEGEEVALLALVDSAVPAGPAALDDARLLAWFLRDLAGSLARALPVSDEELARLPPEARRSLVLEQALAAGILPADTGLPQLQRILGVFEANLRAMERYTPAPIAAPTVLIRAAEGVAGQGGPPGPGWSRWIGRLKTYAAPGDHYALMASPNVDAVAERLRPHLDRAG